MNLESLARYLIIFGIVLTLVGVGVYAVSRLGIPLGRLPGDLRFQRDNLTCFFPIATSILLSIILTVILNLIARFFHK